MICNGLDLITGVTVHVFPLFHEGILVQVRCDRLSKLLKLTFNVVLFCRLFNYALDEFNRLQLVHATVPIHVTLSVCSSLSRSRTKVRVGEEIQHVPSSGSTGFLGPVRRLFLLSISIFYTKPRGPIY